VIDLALATSGKASARTLLLPLRIAAAGFAGLSRLGRLDNPTGPYIPYAPLQHSAGHGEVTDGLHAAFGRG
jgi:hypothetical protein